MSLSAQTNSSTIFLRKQESRLPYRIHIGLTGGVCWNSHILHEENNDRINDFNSETRDGLFLGVNVGFPITNAIGCGVKYYSGAASEREGGTNPQTFYYHLGGSADNPGDSSLDRIDGISEYAKVKYVGPYFSFTRKIGGRHAFCLDAGAGYIRLDRTQNWFGLTPHYKAVSANTIGFNGGLSYEYQLNQNLSIGAEFSALYAYFKTPQYDDRTYLSAFYLTYVGVGDPEIFYNFNLGVSLRYYLR